MSLADSPQASRSARELHGAALLLGAPGAGKGTQGKILGTVPGFFHLSCGDVFRSIDIGTPEGRLIYETISRGELVPDDLTVRVWRKGLDGRVATSAFKPREDLLILDGIPRNVHQAEMLREHVDVLRIIHLVCPDEEAMIHRIKRRAIRENRVDDANEKIIRHRFDIYRAESEPVLKSYPQEIIHHVNAIGSPARVLRDVLDVLIPAQDELFNRQDQPSRAPVQDINPSAETF